jgi:predicted SnoaL-like aldol condensation-catalyzing enzyme
LLTNASRASALIVCSVIGACTTAGTSAKRDGRPQHSNSCTGSVQEHRDIVLAFYQQALIGLQPATAFERYVAPEFVEHKPDVEQGSRDGTVKYLEKLIASVPQPRWEVLRTISEGDLVFLHARFTPAPGAPAYAVADVFRLSNCLIVEHWDVVAGPPADQRNPHPRF